MQFLNLLYLYRDMRKDREFRGLPESSWWQAFRREAKETYNTPGILIDFFIESDLWTQTEAKSIQADRVIVPLLSNLRSKSAAMAEGLWEQSLKLVEGFSII